MQNLHNDRTLLMIKPNNGEDAPRAVATEVLNELNLNLISVVTILPTKELMEEFYKPHKGKEFFPELIKYVSSGPCYVYFIKGENAIEKVRVKLGATDPAEAAENTWRKKYGRSITENLAHASDSAESYEHEASTILKYIMY